MDSENGNEQYKQQLRKLLKRCMPDALIGRADSVIADVNRVAGILGALSKVKRFDRWPDGLGYKVGEPVVLVGKTLEDKIVRSKRAIPLPGDPKLFMEVLETFLDFQKLPPQESSARPEVNEQRGFGTRASRNRGQERGSETRRSENLDEEYFQSQLARRDLSISDLQSLYTLAQEQLPRERRESILQGIDEKYLTVLQTFLGRVNTLGDVRAHVSLASEFPFSNPALRVRAFILTDARAARIIENLVKNNCNSIADARAYSGVAQDFPFHDASKRRDALLQVDNRVVSIFLTHISNVSKLSDLRAHISLARDFPFSSAGARRGVQDMIDLRAEEVFYALLQQTSRTDINAYQNIARDFPFHSSSTLERILEQIRRRRG